MDLSNQNKYIEVRHILPQVTMDFAITTMSSKGQIVIPTSMRSNIKVGDKLILIQNKDQLIVKKADSLNKQFKEDIEFAKRTEKALKRYEQGKFITMSKDKFLKELEKW